MEIIFSQKQNQEIALKILEKISKTPKKNQARVILFCGPLGSGKTALTQKIAGVLKIKEKVKSPTFNLLKKYKIPQNKNFPWQNLIHIDFYRLKNKKDLEGIGFFDFQKDSKNLIIIEWGNLLEKFLIEDTFKVSFSYISETERKISF